MAHDVLERAPDDRVEILDPTGEILEPELVPDLETETLYAMYRDMKFCRRFDERMISLQRRGRVGTYPALAGQEGSQIGSTYALADEDLLSFQYREHGAVVSRELPWEYLSYWMGHEVGNSAIAELNVFPLNISIGAHVPHVVGWSWAAKLADDDRVGVVHFGDGASSEGDVHEAMNFAGVFDTPTIFLCHNNQWAISVPRERQTAANTLAQRGRAYGFDGVQVDGMDPLATYVVTKAARKKALDASSDSRPTLIEAIQYRYGAHTTADDPSVYRDEDELEEWRERDPLDRFELYLRKQGYIDNDHIESVEAEIEESLERLVERALEYEPDPQEMFEYAYEEPTDRLESQRETFASLRSTHGDEALLEDE